jgi:DNA-binding NarL/FixJ family response regulator
LDWMPSEIVVPREILEAERRTKQAPPKGRNAPKNLLADRDAEILSRYRSGEKAAAIAEDLDLHVVSVMRAINRAEEAA